MPVMVNDPVPCDPSSSHPSEAEEGSSRDEVKEIEKLSQKETARVRTWRLIVTGILLLTGAAVTTSSYIALIDQEQENFEDAVSTIRYQNNCLT